MEPKVSVRALDSANKRPKGRLHNLDDLSLCPPRGAHATSHDLITSQASIPRDCSPSNVKLAIGNRLDLTRNIRHHSFIELSSQPPILRQYRWLFLFREA